MDALNHGEYIMISNRGPDFFTPGKMHVAMGGTKSIYPEIMDAFCSKWICLSSEELNTGSAVSRFGDKLDIIFLRPETYHAYYHEYVSETLYPMLLGYKDRATDHDSRPFDEVMKLIADRYSRRHLGQNAIICDYHLYQLPRLIPQSIRKVFFWFIPMLTIDHYDESIRDVLDGLNAATEIYFVDDVWAQNFINVFHHFMPGRTLRVKVRTVMMGPDAFFGKFEDVTREEYAETLTRLFGCAPRGRHVVSVSRMDFVKRIPLLIEGFERYVDASGDVDTKLLIFAPHHRRDSTLYGREGQIIKDAIRSSRHRERLFLRNEVTRSQDLGVVYAFADVFVCMSQHDAMPLTPLEYVLANGGRGSVVLSDSIGAYRLLRSFAHGFEAESAHALARALSAAVNEAPEARAEAMDTMKRIVGRSTVQRAIDGLAVHLTRQSG